MSVEPRIGGGAAQGRSEPFAEGVLQDSRETTDRASRRKKDALTVQQLMDSCQGMVRTVAWTIHQRLPPHVELDDLIAYGQLGLAQAAETFRPERGRFATYAFYRVRGAILDGLSKMSWFSRHEYHARRYEQMSYEMLAIDEGGEIAGTKLDESPQNNVQWLRDVSGSLSVVYLASGIDESSAIQMCDDRSHQPDELAIEQELRQRLCTLVEHLPSDAGDLIRMTYFEGLSLTEAASRLGVSRSWACRLHARTLKRLAKAMNQLGEVEVLG
jgi:RNA polymerase sigma factor FliA